MSNRWAAYALTPPEQLRQYTLETLEELDWKFRERRRGVPLLQRLMVGAREDSWVFHVETDMPFHLEIIQVTGDPAFRLVALLFGTQDPLFSIVQIRPVSHSTEPSIKSLIRGVVGKTPVPPWELQHHVRFRSAFLLRMRTKNQWNRWL